MRTGCGCGSCIKERENKIKKLEKALDEIENCLLCAVIAEPMEIIENTLNIINEIKFSSNKG